MSYFGEVVFFEIGLHEVYVIYAFLQDGAPTVENGRVEVRLYFEWFISGVVEDGLVDFVERTLLVIFGVFLFRNPQKL